MQCHCMCLTTRTRMHSTSPPAYCRMSVQPPRTIPTDPCTPPCFGPPTNHRSCKASDDDHFWGTSPRTPRTGLDEAGCSPLHPHRRPCTSPQYDEPRGLSCRAPRSGSHSIGCWGRGPRWCCLRSSRPYASACCRRLSGIRRLVRRKFRRLPGHCMAIILPNNSKPGDIIEDRLVGLGD